MIRVVSSARQIEISGQPSPTSEELWLTREELADLTGWHLKAEGLCKADACVPLAPALAESVVDGERVDAAKLWNALDRPVLHDAARSTWMLGDAAADRARQLESLEAPNFTLPDLEGRLHSLSDQRGKKVLLATWASW